jgi:hypothetical protein
MSVSRFRKNRRILASRRDAKAPRTARTAGYGNSSVKGGEDDRVLTVVKRIVIIGS